MVAAGVVEAANMVGERELDFGLFFLALYYDSWKQSI